MKDYQFYRIICKNILAGKFNWEKYKDGGVYFGKTIYTQPLHCSYGLIGFIVSVNNNCDICYDREERELDIDDMPYKQYINQSYLEDNGISVSIDDDEESAELETYTEAGEDMILNLDHLTQADLQEYIDTFDIDEEVLNWWRDGAEAASRAGVPNQNIRDHYNDYEIYLKTLRSVCRYMPY